MSTRFGSFLHETGQRLSLPRATRTAILVEIAADLEDLFQYYLEQGLTEEEAAARAEEKVDMSDGALAELVSVHSSVRSWPQRIVSRPQPFWERLAMAAIVVFMFALALLGPETPMFFRSSMFVWPVLVILVVLVVTSVVQGVRVFDREPGRPRRIDLAMPVFLGSASVLIGFGGFAIDMYVAFRAMAAAPESWAPIFAQAFLGAVSTVVIALLVALVAAVAWFVLAGRVARMEKESAMSFLEVSR